MDQLGRKFIFAARIADQPLQYRHRVDSRIIATIKSKGAGSLERYIKHVFKRRPNILEEWHASKAEVGFIRKEFPNARKFWNSVYWKIYRRKMPLDYVLGWTPFMGMRFKVKPPVLIPRHDTAIWATSLVERLERINDPLRILEVGTGTGCISISMAKVLPQHRFTAIDISPSAINLARFNMKKLLGSLNTSVELWVANLFFLEKLLLLNQFDLIVSNPPYIPAAHRSTKVAPSVMKWESTRALIGGSNPFGISFHLKLFDLAFNLKPMSKPLDRNVPRLAMELDGSKRQASMLGKLSKKMGYSKMDVIHDDNHRPRALFIY